MKLNYKSFILVLATLIAGGCSDKTEWTPGPEVEQTMGVYFDALSSYDYVFTPGDDMSLSFNISRINSDEPATVPIKVLSAPQGVVIPENVAFNAGQETVKVVLDLTDLPIKTNDKIKLEIDPAYSFIYSKGTSTLTLGVTYSDWELLADNVRVKYTNYSNVETYPSTTCQLRVLEGTDKMKFTNFMDSGVDLYFTLKQTSLTYPTIVPYKNVQYIDADSNYLDVNDKNITDWENYDWYLYDEFNVTWPQWYIGDSTTLIEFAEFFGDGYCYMSLEEGWASFCGYVSIDNGNWTGIYVNLFFDAITTD